MTVPGASTGDRGGPVVLADGPDLAGLRARRRRRVFDAMAAHDVDVLIMGRPAEVAYATGTRQLWLAGSRPFGPAGIAIAATGRIHLLGTSVDGVPDEVGFGDLFAMSWNPGHVEAAVAGLDGMAGARRVATTSGTVGFDAFVASVAPHATVVDGAAMLDAVRRIKDVEEVACIEAATALATDALGTVARATVAGVSERELLATYLGRLGELGVPTPPTEGVVCVLDAPSEPTLRRVVTDRRLEVGDRVVIDVGANVAAYEGGIGTTVVVGADDGNGPDGAGVGEDGVEGGGRGGGGGSDRDGDGDDHDGHGARADRRSRSLTRLRPTAALRAGRVLEAVVGACRPGAVGAHIRRTAIDAGGSIPADGLVYGIGMGVEPPVIGPDVGDGVVLEADMVLAVCAWVADAREGGWYERRLVRVVPDGNGPAELIGSEPLPPVGPVTLRRGDAQ